VQTSSRVAERSRVRSAQQRAIATELILQQLEMANTYLETAVDTLDDSVKVSLIAHAGRSPERISTWLVNEACSEEQAGLVLDALRTSEGSNIPQELIEAPDAARRPRRAPTAKLGQAAANTVDATLRLSR